MLMRPALALALLATPALAKSPRDMMFPSDASCYLRQYTPLHLAGHPDQRVTLVALGPLSAEWGDPRYLVLTVALHVRGTSERYQAVAYCENESDHLYCQMEGDAGGFVLTPGRDGALRMALGRGGIGFEGAQDFLELSGTTGDDRVFLLPAVPADACP